MQGEMRLRYQTGDICPETGLYDFDGFVEQADETAARLESFELPLAAGQRFPPIGEPKRACYWRLVDDLAGTSGAGAHASAGAE